MKLDNNLLALQDSLPEEQNHDKPSPADVQSRRHPIFWFDDGSLLLRVQNQLFKVHRTLLFRHSHFLPTLTKKSAEGGNVAIAFPGDNRVGLDIDLGGFKYHIVDSRRRILADDVEVLLGHIYHDHPLASDSPFSRVASVLRASSPQQLDFPSLHKLSRQLLEAKFPTKPIPFFRFDYLEDALALATEYQITSIQKAILYCLVTTSNFDTESDLSRENVETVGVSLTSTSLHHETEESGRKVEQNNSLSESTSSPTLRTFPHSGEHVHSTLSVSDSQRCMKLMNQLIDHFTPPLFTPATTPHMACTDVFAETWMRLVIQPALEDDGVYKPIETLERMRVVDWAEEGLCTSCVLEKREEWRLEQEEVWRLMDDWLELGSPGKGVEDGTVHGVTVA